MYKFGILDPRPGADNSAVLGPQTLGVEVTIPALAAGCGLGNFDPQHTGSDAGTAAIEASLTAELPPDGATLVTVRADADSVGAMAVLSLRHAGQSLPVGAKERIRLIAEADREASGSWPGVRSIGSPHNFVGPVAPLAAEVADFRRPLGERVQIAITYLLTGTFPGEEEVRERLRTEAAQALDGLDTYVEGCVAVVVGNHRLAMGLGYRLSPVVVATNPGFRFQCGEPHRKHTVARWNTSVAMDWEGLKAALAGREPGWGGSPSILGSPQGIGSQLTTEEVVGLVQRFLPGN